MPRRRQAPPPTVARAAVGHGRLEHPLGQATRQQDAGGLRDRREHEPEGEDATQHVGRPVQLEHDPVERLQDRRKADGEDAAQPVGEKQDTRDG